MESHRVNSIISGRSPPLHCTLTLFYNLPVSRFGYTQTEMKHNKFITNKLTTTASQDQSQKPQQEYVFFNLPVSGIQGQTEMKHTKFKTNKLTIAAWTKQSYKVENDKTSKKNSCGMVLMASTMLHEKCCNTVLRIGAPLKNNNSFTVLPRVTYSASDVERMTHFCVLENKHTHAPPHVIAPPNTDLLSVALLA